VAIKPGPSAVTAPTLQKVIFGFIATYFVCLFSLFTNQQLELMFHSQ